MKPRAWPLGLEATLLLGIAGLDVLLLACTPYTLASRDVLPILAGCAFLLALQLIYSRWRSEPRLAGLARTALLFALGTNALGALSYLLTGLSERPLYDAQFAAWDQALGFDWPAYHQALLATPALVHLTTLSYAALGIELILLILVLDLIGRPARARELFLGFSLSALAVILIGALFPAAGAYVHYASPERYTEPYVAQYLGLRDGSVRVIALFKMQGVVQFPSFHAALAAVCGFIVRGTRLFWPLLPVNLLVIASTPPAGGHHLVDVLAGLAIAAVIVAGLRVLKRCENRSGLPSRLHCL